MVSLIDREVRRPSMMELGLLWSADGDREAGARGKVEGESVPAASRSDGRNHKDYIEGLTVNN